MFLYAPASLFDIRGAFRPDIGNPGLALPLEIPFPLRSL